MKTLSNILLEKSAYRTFNQIIRTWIKSMSRSQPSYRINNYILTTNLSSFRMKLFNDLHCSIWLTEEEGIIHLLWECHFVNRFYNDVYAFFHNVCLKFNLSKRYVLLGRHGTNTSSALILYLKYFTCNT